METVDLLLGHVSSKHPDDAMLADNLQKLSLSMQVICDELSQHHPDGMLPLLDNASEELEAVMATTAEAADTIMAAAEEIQQFVASRPVDEATPIENAVIRIVEACSFQDLTGQRMRKIRRALQNANQRVNALSHILTKRFVGITNKSKKTSLAVDPLMEGPQMRGQGVSQDQVDELLNM